MIFFDQMMLEQGNDAMRGFWLQKFDLERGNIMRGLPVHQNQISKSNIEIDRTSKLIEHRN